MGLPRPKEEGVSGSNIRCAIFVAYFSSPRNNQIKLGFGPMGMIGAIRFARRDTDEGKVKRMAFGQIEGIGLAAEGNGDFLDGFGVLPTGRLALLCANMSDINFFHDLTIIKLHVAIYVLLHRGNIPQKAAREQAGERSIHGSRSDSDPFPARGMYAHEPMNGSRQQNQSVTGRTMLSVQTVCPSVSTD